MKLGLYNEMDLSRARELFTSLGVEFEIATDPKALEDYDFWFKQISHAADRGQTRYSPVFIYIQISDEDFERLKDRLIRDELYIEPVEDPMTFDAEYGCPDCDFIERAPGVCPRHGKELLHYADWIDVRKKSMSRLAKFTTFLLLIVVLFGILKLIQNS